MVYTVGPFPFQSTNPLTEDKCRVGKVKMSLIFYYVYWVISIRNITGIGMQSQVQKEAEEEEFTVVRSQAQGFCNNLDKFPTSCTHFIDRDSQRWAASYVWNKSSRFWEWMNFSVNLMGNTQHLTRASVPRPLFPVHQVLLILSHGPCPWLESLSKSLPQSRPPVLGPLEFLVPKDIRPPISKADGSLFKFLQRFPKTNQDAAWTPRACCLSYPNFHLTNFGVPENTLWEACEM